MLSRYFIIGALLAGAHCSPKASPNQLRQWKRGTKLQPLECLKRSSIRDVSKWQTKYIRQTRKPGLPPRAHARVTGNGNVGSIPAGNGYLANNRTNPFVIFT
jgi:hypothetical protein